MRAVRITLAVVIAALSVLPIGTWLGIPFQRALLFRAMDWGSGIAMVVLLAVVFLAVLRRDAAAEALAQPLRRLIARWESRPHASTWALAIIAAGTYALTSWMVLDAKPLLIDELVQVIQARTFAEGRLWLPLDPYPEFRSLLHMVQQDGRWYAQFPPGGPAMLALGELVRAPWLVNPVCGGVSAAALAYALRWSGARPGVSLGASVAFAFAPFIVFQSASHMNHVTSLMWMLIATAALVRATHGERERPLAGLVCGLALGAAATIRPLDAAAWALPAAAWLAWRAVRSGQWRTFVISGVGVAVPFALMMWVNAQTTGGALTFGYSVLWGNSHGLGFHTSPWGESHTVARGLGLTAAYLHSLNEYLFEVPAPSLLPALAAIALIPRVRPLERYLFASAGLVLGAYFAYWHDGFFLGPRFMVPLVPIAALLVAQLPGLVADLAGPTRPLAPRAVYALYVAAALLGATFSLPARVGNYQAGFQSMRWDYDTLAANAGATGGTILVRESWGAQVIHRLWALGVSRSLTEQLYRDVDTCGLDDMATRLEREGVRGAAAEARFLPMLADSARVVPTPYSPDVTERVLLGSVYPPWCVARITDDRAGYTLFGAMLLARDTTTRWIRDFHARDTLVVSLDSAKSVWLFRRRADIEMLVPEFVRLNPDSLRAAWYGVRSDSAGTGRGGRGQ